MNSRTEFHMTRRRMLAGTGAAAGAVLFAACAQGGMAPTMGDAPASDEMEEAVEMPAIGMRPTNFWAIDMGGSNWVQGIGEQIVAEYHEANPDEQVNVIVTTYGDTINKLPTVVAGGISPDISYIDAYLPKDFGVRGIAADITNYVKASTVIDPEDYYPRVVFDSTYRGHWFGLPWAPTVFTYFYNKDVFVEVGLDPDSGPANWDELDSAIQQTLKKEGDNIERLGFWYGNSSLVWWLVPFWQQGGRLLSDDELTSTIDNETMETAFNLTLRFFDLQGGLDAMNAFRGDERHQHLFSTGRCAMWTDVMNITRFAQYEEAFATINVGVDTYPVAEGGSPAAYRGGGAHLMPEGSNNPDGAFKFLEWLFLEPNDRRFNDVRDSLPARRSVAQSPEFTQGDPLRIQGAREMDGAQWVVSAPGGRRIIGIHVGMANSIWNREKTVPEALADGNAQVQQALDEALENSVVDF
ncbi:MAG: extracellular solute-binding protein [Chloroflexi bacterium]|nr:extracellular solute-binding protein [Chloroflexota bacterium]